MPNSFFALLTRSFTMHSLSITFSSCHVKVTCLYVNKNLMCNYNNNEIFTQDIDPPVTESNTSQLILNQKLYFLQTLLKGY